MSPLPSLSSFSSKRASVPSSSPPFSSSSSSRAFHPSVIAFVALGVNNVFGVNNILGNILLQVVGRDAWQEVPGKGGICSGVGVAARTLVAAIQATLAQAADTSLLEVAGLTAAVHHGLRGVELC